MTGLFNDDIIRSVYFIKCIRTLYSIETNSLEGHMSKICSMGAGAL